MANPTPRTNGADRVDCADLERLRRNMLPHPRRNCSVDDWKWHEPVDGGCVRPPERACVLDKRIIVAFSGSPASGLISGDADVRCAGEIIVSRDERKPSIDHDCMDVIAVGAAVKGEDSDKQCRSARPHQGHLIDAEPLGQRHDNSPAPPLSVAMGRRRTYSRPPIEASGGSAGGQVKPRQNRAIGRKAAAAPDRKRQTQGFAR